MREITGTWGVGTGVYPPSARDLLAAKKKSECEKFKGESNRRNKLATRYFPTHDHSSTVTMWSTNRWS